VPPLKCLESPKYIEPTVVEVGEGLAGGGKSRIILDSWGGAEPIQSFFPG
jgi:hypothetical protein